MEFDKQLSVEEMEIVKLKEDIHLLLDSFEQILRKEANNRNITISKLKNRIDYIKWMMQKYDLRDNKSPIVVRQREIFFCEFGENIGCEQNSRRPVVILQNNVGNSKSETIVVAPITSYEGSIFYIDEYGECRIKYSDSKGELVDRKLNYYEVFVEIEPNYSHYIYGVINICHIRGISKKRLAQTPVAKITQEAFNNAVDAIIENLRVV